MEDWTALSGVAPVERWEEDPDGPTPASYLASTLSASLELAKEGALTVRQMGAFEEIYLRTRTDEGEGAS